MRVRGSGLSRTEDSKKLSKEMWQIFRSLFLVIGTLVTVPVPVLGSRHTVSTFSALFFVVASVASSKKSDGAPILRDFGFISEIDIT